MHFKLTTRAAPGLRVIPEIRDYSICRLEGLNGVGKTLAVRLLEIATGARPYESSPAMWQSLRAALQEAKIDVGGLKGGQTLQLVLDPTRWPDDPKAADLDLLGSAQIDGHQTTLSEAAALLSIERIGGDESLLQHFRAEIVALQQQIRHTQQSLELRWREVEQLFEALPDELGSLSSALDRADYEKRDGLQAHRASLLASRQAAAKQVQRIHELADAESLLERVRMTLPDLEQRLRDVEAQLAELEEQRTALQAQLNQKLRAKAQAEQLIDELQRVRKNQQRADTERVEAETGLTRLLATLTLSESEIEAEARTAAARLDELHRQRDDLDSLPTLIQLVDRVSEAVTSGSSDDLQDEAIASISGLEVTPRNLSVGLQERRVALSVGAPFKRLVEIDQALADLETRVKSLNRAKSLVASKKRALDRADRWSREVSRLEEQVEQYQVSDDDIAGEIAALGASLEQLVRHRVELRTTRSDLFQFGEPTELEARVATIRAEVDADPTNARSLVEATMAGERISEELGAVTLRLDEIERVIKQFELRVSEATARLTIDPAYGWVRAALGAHLPSSSTEPVHAAATLIKIHEAGEAIHDASTSVEQSIARVTQTLDSVAARLDSTSRDTGKQIEAPEIVMDLEQRFADSLRNRHISEALLDGGTVQRVDLGALDIVWRARDGELRRRPIEAFSSGERAFAYVMARMRSLRESEQTSENRVLVLDEFGAFMSGDRLRVLQNFLAEDVVGSAFDQVLIILPMRSDPASLEDDEFFKSHQYTMQDGLG